MRIPAAEAERMAAHLRAGYPDEACGALLGRGSEVARVAPLPNRETQTPRVRYQIDPRDLVRLDREARDGDLDIIGYFHSHPDGHPRPSETDRSRAAESLSDGVFHVVAAVEGGQKVTPTAWVFREATQAFEPEPWEIVLNDP
jgi:proteasome lid subunit RPN8/RPN11